MSQTPSSPEVPTPFEGAAAQPKRWALILSFALSLALVAGALVVVALSSPAKAATYTQSFTAANWTSPSAWTCSAVGPGSTGCGNYPGDPGAPGAANGDLANMNSFQNITVNSTVGNAVTLSQSNGGLAINGGGQLSLVGTSSVALSGGFFSINGGTLANTGTLNLSTTGGTLSFDSGTLNGAGVTNVNGTFSVTGSTGPMFISGQTVANAGTINFSSAANPLTLNSTIANTGTFSISGAAPINGGGSITNSGTLSTTSPTTPVGVTFNNSGNVNETITGAKFSFTGGGTHTGVFNTAGTGAGFDFGGTHTFNAGSLFTGGPVQNLSGGSWIVNTALTISGAFSNGGTLSFGGAAQTISPSTFTQSGSGAFSPRLLANNVNDKLTVTAGTATLGGTLSPSLGYTPATGDSFVVLTSSADSGSMAYTPLTYPGGQIQATFGASSVSLAAVATADLSIAKTAASPTITHNQNTTFTVTVTNLGPSNATSVNVQDTLSGGTVVSATPSQGSCTGTAPIACSLGPILNGGTATISVVVLGDTVGSMSNSATVFSSVEVDPNSANDTASAAVTVNPAADLGIAITDSPDPVNAGGGVTYTATVNNAGPDAGDANVSFSITGGTITGATGAGGFGCTFTATTASCSFSGPMPVTTGTITVNATAGAGPTMALTGTVSTLSPTVDPNSTNNSATQSTAVNASADLAITKSGPPNWVAGQNNFYTITVTNNGPSNVTNVVVTDPTPAGMTFVSNSGACTTNFPCTIASLTSGSSVTITSTYQLASSASGTVSNTASVSTTSATDSLPTNNSSTATSTIVATSDFGVVKTGPASATPGSTIVYSVDVKNFGPSDALSPVTVSDPTPAGLTLVSVSGGGCTAYPCAVGPLAANTFVTITGTYTVTATSGAVTNTASVPTGDPNATNDSSSVTTSITPQADLAVTKSGPADIPSSGQITFVIAVKNNGPGAALNVTLSDPTPAGTGFLSASAPCSAGFPCLLSSIPSGSTVTINATYAVGATTTSVTNTASVSSSRPDPISGNNSASATVTGTVCPDAPTQITPLPGATGVPVDGLLQWTSTGGTSYEVYFGPVGRGCSSLMGTAVGSSFAYTGLTPGTTYESRIVALKTGCNPQPSSCVSWTTAKPACTLPQATLREPSGNATIGSPITFRWDAVTGAETYHVFASVNGGAFIDLGGTSDTSLTATLANGSVTWYVTASAKDCGTSTSARSTFNVCTTAAPLISVVGAPTSGQQYKVSWEAVPGAVSYKLDEASNDSFRDAVTQNVDGLSATFSHTTTTGALTYFYRVRAVGTCAAEGPYSRVVRVVILPPPANVKYPNFDIPAGTRNPVDLDIFIEGDPSGPQNFVITLDKPWMLSVTPSTGVLPPSGITVKLTVDPSALPDGSVTGTLLVTLTPVSASSRIVSNASKPKPVPVTVNLVTPVTPTSVAGPSADTIIIPAVGRLTGVNSQWRSDVRIFNGSSQALKYQLDFVPSQANESKRTTVNTAAGDTTALDDLIHNWYGFGEVGDSASGVLQIQALTTGGSKPPSSSLATVVSSRTYNNTASNGTLGQYIPGILFSNFIGKGTQALSLQQLAQTASYRTNVGVLEASGKPATVLLSVLNNAGQKLTQDFSIDLKGGQQLALNQLLADKGITAADARIEVRVTGGDGRVSAYASVVDNSSQDPLLVSPVLLGQTTAQKYVLPGVADVNTGTALWRSDVRILNGGSTTQTLNLLFYAQGNAANPLAAALTINPGETKVLDSVLSSLFATSNAGGAVHVNTAAQSQLVVTGRTFNQTSNGTLGQFIPAATLADGIAAGGRSLNILQVEDSVRYRTNVGLAEMSGNAATVEVSVHLPDSKVTPTVRIPLGANEFRQFALGDLGLENIYNARVSITVTEGSGRVTAYGSVIDMLTTDPTYVPAQ